MKLQLKSYHILLTKNSRNQSFLIRYVSKLPLQDRYCLSVCVADDMSRLRNMKREAAVKVISNSVNKRFIESEFLNSVHLVVTSAGPLLSVSMCRWWHERTEKYETSRWCNVLFFLGLSIWFTVVRIHSAGCSSAPVLAVLCLELDSSLESSWDKEGWMNLRVSVHAVTGQHVFLLSHHVHDVTAVPCRYYQLMTQLHLLKQYSEA